MAVCVHHSWRRARCQGHSHGGELLGWSEAVLDGLGFQAGNGVHCPRDTSRSQMRETVRSKGEAVQRTVVFDRVNQRSSSEKFQCSDTCILISSVISSTRLLIIIHCILHYGCRPRGWRELWTHQSAIQLEIAGIERKTKSTDTMSVGVRVTTESLLLARNVTENKVRFKAWCSVQSA